MMVVANVGMRCPVKPGMTAVANAGMTAAGAMPGMTAAEAGKAGVVSGMMTAAGRCRA